MNRAFTCRTRWTGTRFSTSLGILLGLSLLPGTSAADEPNTNSGDDRSQRVVVDQGKDDMRAWVQTGVLEAAEAFQAAAADDRYVYAINNTTVARYDRESGERLAISHGAAKHLNSGWFHAGKLYCAHSNYPQKPERSEIKLLDLESMELTTFHDFGEWPYGSLTWAFIHDGDWWCNFAHYDDDNHRTVLVRFGNDWRETAQWHYPPAVLKDLGRYSLSGGVILGDELLATGHDDRKLYRLRVPSDGEILEHLGTVPAPFTGQGIAVDPVTGGLIGIDRPKRQILYAQPSTETP